MHVQCLTLPAALYPPGMNTYLINNLFPFILSLAPVPYGTLIRSSNSEVLTITREIISWKTTWY
jgi:hypothetical protein